MAVASILKVAFFLCTCKPASGEALSEGRPASGLTQADTFRSELEPFSPVVAEDPVSPSPVRIPNSATDFNLLRREPLQRRTEPFFSASSPRAVSQASSGDVASASLRPRLADAAASLQDAALTVLRATSAFSRNEITADALDRGMRQSDGVAAERELAPQPREYQDEEMLALNEQLRRGSDDVEITNRRLHQEEKAEFAVPVRSPKAAVTNQADAHTQALPTQQLFFEYLGGNCCSRDGAEAQFSKYYSQVSTLVDCEDLCAQEPLCIGFDVGRGGCDLFTRSAVEGWSGVEFFAGTGFASGVESLRLGNSSRCAMERVQCFRLASGRMSSPEMTSGQRVAVLAPYGSQPQQHASPPIQHHTAQSPRPPHRTQPEATGLDPATRWLAPGGLSGVPDAGGAALLEATSDAHQGPAPKQFTSAKGFKGGIVTGNYAPTTSTPYDPSNTQEETPIQRHLVQYTTPGPVVSWTTAPWGWDENWKASSTFNMSRWARYTTTIMGDSAESTSGFDRELPWDVSTTEGSGRPPAAVAYAEESSWGEAPDSGEHREPVGNEDSTSGYKPINAVTGLRD